MQRSDAVWALDPPLPLLPSALPESEWLIYPLELTLEWPLQVSDELLRFQPLHLEDDAIEPLLAGQSLYIGMDGSVVRELRIMLKVGEGTARVMPLEMGHDVSTRVIRPMPSKLSGNGWCRLLWDR